MIQIYLWGLLASFIGVIITHLIYEYVTIKWGNKRRFSLKPALRELFVLHEFRKPFISLVLLSFIGLAIAIIVAISALTKERSEYKRNERRHRKVITLTREDLITGREKIPLDEIEHYDIKFGSMNVDDYQKADKVVFIDDNIEKVLKNRYQ